MSASEIADNKWELQASKPPMTSAGGIAQLILMGGFCCVFLYLIIFSIIGAVTPKPEDGGLAGQYKNMKAEMPKKAEEAPPAEAE